MKALLLVWALFSLGGCSMISKVIAEKPKLELKSIEVSKVSWTAIEMKIKVSITNPNSFAVGLRKLNYRVLLEEEEVGKGNYTEEFTVPAKEEKTLAIPFSLDGATTLKLAKNFLTGKSEQLKARILGLSEISTPVGSFEVAFDETKDIVSNK